MKKVLFFIIVIASFFIIRNLVVSIYNLWQKQDLIVAAQKELEEAKKKNREYKAQASKVNSPQFVEEQARNKLFMVKPEESVIVISKDLLSASRSASVKPKEVRANWQQWLELFF